MVLPNTCIVPAALVLALCVAQASAAGKKSRLDSERGHSRMRVDDLGFQAGDGSAKEEETETQQAEDPQASSQHTSGLAIGAQAEEDTFQDASEVVLGATTTPPPQQSIVRRVTLDSSGEVQQLDSSGEADVQERVDDSLDFGDGSLEPWPTTNRSSLLEDRESDANWHLVASEGAGSCGTDNVRLLHFPTACQGLSSPYRYKIQSASGSQWVEFISETCIFTSGVNMNIPISSVKASSTSISSGGAKFCKACGGGVKWGDTCWGVVMDGHRSCGCNSGGWTGTGMYYGGYSPGSCNRCGCWGGGFAGIRTNGQQKGKVCTNGLKIYVNKPADCVWGAWAEWGACSKSCGGGTRARTRGTKSPAKGGGKACSGPTTDSGACPENACPTTTTTTTSTTATTGDNSTAKSSSVSLCRPMWVLMVVVSIVVLCLPLPMPA